MPRGEIAHWLEIIGLPYHAVARRRRAVQPVRALHRVVPLHSCCAKMHAERSRSHKCNHTRRGARLFFCCSFRFVLRRLCFACIHVLCAHARRCRAFHCVLWRCNFKPTDTTRPGARVRAPADKPHGTCVAVAYRACPTPSRPVPTRPGAALKSRFLQTQTVCVCASAVANIAHRARTHARPVRLRLDYKV